MSVSNVNFVHDIETHSPLSMRYKHYWKMIKRRCIEGYWSHGKYMPGPLYYYANLGRILMFQKGAKTRGVGRPYLRDVEWDKAYVYLEAKGFSGFEGDDGVTCSTWVNQIHEEKNAEEKLRLFAELTMRGKLGKFDFNGEPQLANLKRYELARTYMRKIHWIDLGKPHYYNSASNVIDIETRRIGKSMFAGNALIAHNFLFDGAVDYDVYLDAVVGKRPLSSETLVGAIDSKYTKDLLSKTQLGLDELPGASMFNGVLYPSPLTKSYRGTFAAGKYIEAAYDVKNSGGWVTKGSRSKIHNRSFADNPLAGNGTGPNLVVIEEVGFMNNLIDTLGALRDATYEGSDKFGVIWGTGTSGEMSAAAVSEAKEVFFNPKAYDCLEFEDIYEGKGKIGYFVPYMYRLDEYRDSEGIVNKEAATKQIVAEREVLKKGRNQRSLYSNMQNNPNVPSEAFLVDNANLFPTPELKDHLGWLESNEHDGFTKGQCGELVHKQNSTGEVTMEWVPDIKNKLRPCRYGLKKDDITTGCIQIWEHPVKLNGTIPYGLYIAGTDPYDQDKANSSVSLGSTFIFKTFHTDDGIYEWPVAEYTARPDTAIEHHETVRRLLLYYNAIDLYENERNTLKMHFEQKKSLHLLAKTPTILKATANSTVQRTYGTHMTSQIKSEIEIYTRDWLNEPCGDGRLNLHKIYSKGLLEELINYNETGNFDRVIAFMLCILYRLQNHNIKVMAVKKDECNKNDFLNRMGSFYK